jgi:hypothetical protein
MLVKLTAGEDELEFLNFRKKWDLMEKEMTELKFSGKTNKKKYVNIFLFLKIV